MRRPQRDPHPLGRQACHRSALPRRPRRGRPAARRLPQGAHVMKRLMLGAAVAALALVAPSAANALNVSAATSLTNVMPEIKRDATYSFGGSNTLQLQIERGAPADLFLSAEPEGGPGAVPRGPLPAARHVRHQQARAGRAPWRPEAGAVRSTACARAASTCRSATPAVPIGDYTRRLLRRLRLSSVLTTNKRLPAVQRRPGALAGRLRRRRRRLRLRDRRAHAA